MHGNSHCILLHQLALSLVITSQRNWTSIYGNQRSPPQSFSNSWKSHRQLFWPIGPQQHDVYLIVIVSAKTNSVYMFHELWNFVSLLYYITDQLAHVLCWWHYSCLLCSISSASSFLKQPLQDHDLIWITLTLHCCRDYCQLLQKCTREQTKRIPDDESLWDS